MCKARVGQASYHEGLFHLQCVACWLAVFALLGCGQVGRIYRLSFYTFQES